MLNKKIIGIAIFVCAIGGFILIIQFFNALYKDDSCDKELVLAQIVLAHNPEVATVLFTDRGVFPECSVVISGGKVIWVNKTEKTIQVSSDPHPVHSDNSEISNGKFVLQLEPGQSANIMVKRKGIFGFHDHIQPNLSGRIIIK